MAPVELLTAVPLAADAASASYAHGSVVPETRAPVRALAMAKRLHDTVAQRLAGLSLVLAADNRPFDTDERERCREEILAAMRELRAGLEDALDGACTPLRSVEQEVEELRTACPGVRIEWSKKDGSPDRSDALTDALVAEALRNARKHAQPSEVHIERTSDAETVTVTVRNDGVRAGRTGCGIGLRLLEAEAAMAGGLVDSGPEDGGWWRLSLILPA
jgi:signal transduction histidine kinase